MFIHFAHYLSFRVNKREFITFTIVFIHLFKFFTCCDAYSSNSCLHNLAIKTCIGSNNWVKWLQLIATLLKIKQCTGNKEQINIIVCGTAINKNVSFTIRDNFSENFKLKWKMYQQIFCYMSIIENGFCSIILFFFKIKESLKNH